MQDTQAFPHWAFQVLQTLATLGAGGVIVKLVELYLNRKKPVVEAQKAEAEAAEITIRSHSTAGDAMMRLMDRLETASNTNDRLRNERDEWKSKAESAETQRKVDEHYIKRLTAANELGMKLSDMDRPKS